MSSPDSFTCILFWTRNTRNCWIQRHIISSVNRVWTYIHNALHCPLSYSNMQDINMDCAQHLLLFFISDRQFKPHTGKLNHLCWWRNVYLLIDYRNKLGLSINMQLWGTLCFYGTRPERCHMPFGSILLLSNKPIAEPVPLQHYLLPPFRWVFSSVTLFSLLPDISMNTQVNSECCVVSSCYCCLTKI